MSVSIVGDCAAVSFFIYHSNVTNKAEKTVDVSVNPQTKKSIAILPLINDSRDSSNVYIIDGLMDSTLNNLQKIQDLRVISRTSVAKYWTHSKTIPGQQV